MNSRSKLTSAGKDAPQTETEQEYVELQKRYKNMDNERKAITEETQAQLKKQKNMIEKL